MDELAKKLDLVSYGLAWLVRWLALGMVLTTLTIVVMRYVFEIGAIPLQELVIYMHGILFLLGIPYGLRQGTHVRVDLFYSRLEPRTQQIINLAGHLLFLLPVALFILIYSTPYALAAWRILEGSPEVGGLPAVFLLKTLIPLAAALLIFQGFVEILKTVHGLRR